MANYAKVTDGVVTQVIVAEQEFIDTGALGHGWIQTSYNTIGGVHTQGGTPLRGNYAGVGFTYDATNDVFYAPQPFDNWIMNSSWLWVPPNCYACGRILLHMESRDNRMGARRPAPNP